MTDVSHLVIHYSATYADQNLTAADIDKMHRERGWKMIGYHWVIRRDGSVEPGRPESMVGAHVANQNTGKIGICCIGGLDRAKGPDKGVDNRTPAQIESLIKLIRDLLKRYPGAKVVGHRDLAATQCPGFDVQSWWAKVQKKAPPAHAQPLPAAPAHTRGVGEQATHIVRKGETWWSVSQLYGIGLADLLKANGAAVTDTLREGVTISVKILPDTVEVEKPVVPEQVETKVKQKSDRWSWLTGIFGSSAIGLGWLTGMDWQAVIAFGGVLIVMLIIILVLRSQIVAAVKDVREAVEQ